MNTAHFEPSLQAALQRLDGVVPANYARTRNALDGAVTGLSPYLTHGWLSLAQVFETVNARAPLKRQDKLVFELGWRAYYQHVWGHLGQGICAPLRDGPLPEQAYSHTLPDDVLQARSGIPVIDLSVRILYETGYLHNHARMWLASYLVHVRKVHWRAGAQWMLAHLLDGDLASNTLSWQWVAGTGSSKPYLFNADNVAKFAPPAWRSPGSAIDVSYEVQDERARSAEPVVSKRDAARAGAGMAQPVVLKSPPAGGPWVALVQHGSACAQQVSGQDVWLAHPWALGGLPSPLPGDLLTKSGSPRVPPGAMVIGLAFIDAHADMPWSEKRWAFVTQSLQTHTPHLWWADVASAAGVLRNARSLHWPADLHLSGELQALQAALGTLPNAPTVQVHAAPELFSPVAPYCDSFSRWWARTQLMAPLPELAGFEPGFVLERGPQGEQLRVEIRL